ncbi:MAG: hypothetical protein GY696_11315, partial [Gammaproteobacteria bacterium]|nr:hypothetical protein [Gammaproteobacteria bacterium]
MPTENRGSIHNPKVPDSKSNQAGSRTKQRIREYYWWPQLNKTVETLTQNCTPCQNSDKSSKPVKEAIQPVVYPMRQM